MNPRIGVYPLAHLSQPGLVFGAKKNFLTRKYPAPATNKATISCCHISGKELVSNQCRQIGQGTHVDCLNDWPFPSLGFSFDDC